MLLEALSKDVPVVDVGEVNIMNLKLRLVQVSFNGNGLFLLPQKLKLSDMIGLIRMLMNKLVMLPRDGVKHLLVGHKLVYSLEDEVDVLHIHGRVEEGADAGVSDLLL